MKLKTPGLPALYITHREDQGINIRQGSNLVRLSVAEVEQLAQLIQQGNE